VSLHSWATLARIYDDETTEAIRGVFDAIADNGAVVPALWRLQAGLDNAADLGRARAASTQTGDDDRRTSEESAAGSSGSVIYLDSSMALAHLLAEDRFPSEALWDQPLVSSRLLECEVWNRINAHQLQSSHGDAVRNLIGRVAMIEMVGPVLARALQPFPVRM
jgi:hypothetical protein